MKKVKPKLIITYLCSNCGNDFALTEQQKPKCFYCQSEVDFSVSKKQRLSPKVIASRLKLVSDRMMENLMKAYQVRVGESNEKELLETMSKAKNFRDKIHKLKLD